MFKPKLKMPEMTTQSMFKENHPIASLDHLKIIYEDQDLLLVSKPSELLSAPGKTHEFSVKTMIARQYRKATGNLIVHRLDQATSGIMLIALNEKTHRYLSQAFEYKKVKKRYIALLSGHLQEQAGWISFPMRLDPFQRPTQIYDPLFGNEAITRFECLSYDPIKNQSKVHLYPETGRTHQLRLHCAHHLGLGMPIVGDPFYGHILGKESTRLHLHANQIQFKHPNGKEMCIEDDAEF